MAEFRQGFCDQYLFRFTMTSPGLAKIIHEGNTFSSFNVLFRSVDYCRQVPDEALITAALPIFWPVWLLLLLVALLYCSGDVGNKLTP